MNTIFIPTDFQPEFIQLIPTLSKAIEGIHTDIILGHLFKVKDYEQLYWKKNIEIKNINPQFLNECKSNFLSIGNLMVKNFAGSSIAGLKLFFEMNHVNLIINPVDYSFRKISKHTIENPGRIIKRSGYPVNDVHTVYELEKTL